MFIRSLILVFLSVFTTKAALAFDSDSNHRSSPHLFATCSESLMGIEPFSFELESLFGSPDHFILKVYKKHTLDGKPYKPREYVVTVARGEELPFGAPASYQNKYIELSIQGTGTPNKDGTIPGEYIEKNRQGEVIIYKPLVCKYL